MQLHSAKAIDGLKWFDQGIRVFLRNSMPIICILFSYFSLVGILSKIPYLGTLSPSMLTVLFNSIFFIAGRDAQNNKQIELIAVFQKFWTDFTVTWEKLLLLGLISFSLNYLGLILIQYGEIDTLNQNTFAHFQHSISIISFIFLFLMGNVLFWFSPTLVLWEKIGITKAFFYSIITFKRNILAYIVFTICWVIAVFIFFMLYQFSKLLGLNNATVATILFVESTILLSVFYSSLYSTYAGCFKK